jgi:pimeloyl-ACP methyl ester carboxylesterase
MSGAETWWRLEGQVRCRFRTALTERPSIDWRPAIERQRDELRGKLLAGADQLILVGHSNGGMVSRSLAQWAQQQPGPVRGVVTLDSPDQGAIVANNARVLEATTLVSRLGVLSGSPLPAFTYHPSSYDDVPSGAFVRMTNSFDEQFTRVGIRTYTPRRWVFWRIYASATRPPLCTPGAPSGERAAARQAQERYDRYRH